MRNAFSLAPIVIAFIFIAGANAEVSGKTYPSSLSISVASDHQPVAGETFILTATVFVTTDVSHLKIKWALPQGVMLISGKTEELTSAKAGQQITSSVVLQVPDSKNYQIHVMADFGAPGGPRIGSVAQFNTNPLTLNIIHRRILHSAPTTILQ